MYINTCINPNIVRTSTYVFIHTYNIHAGLHLAAFILMCIQTHGHTNMHTHIFSYSPTYILTYKSHICLQACICLYVYTHTYTHTHIHAYMYIHTCI